MSRLWLAKTRQLWRVPPRTAEEEVPPPEPQYLTTEAGDRLVTEAGDPLTTES
jgi:hypothetical protein